MRRADPVRTAAARELIELVLDPARSSRGTRRSTAPARPGLPPPARGGRGEGRASTSPCSPARPGPRPPWPSSSTSSASSPARSAGPRPADHRRGAAGHRRGPAAAGHHGLRRHPHAGGHPGLRRDGRDLAGADGAPRRRAALPRAPAAPDDRRRLRVVGVARARDRRRARRARRLPRARRSTRRCNGEPFPAGVQTAENLAPRASSTPWSPPRTCRRSSTGRWPSWSTRPTAPRSPRAAGEPTRHVTAWESIEVTRRPGPRRRPRPAALRRRPAPAAAAAPTRASGTPACSSR